MLKKILPNPRQARTKRKTCRVLKTCEVNGKSVVTMETINMSDYNAGVYSPDVVNPQSIITTGQTIEGVASYDPTDMETQQTNATEGINAIVEPLNIPTDEN